MRIIKNCPITKNDAKVVKEYDVCLKGVQYHTGIDIQCDSVYSPHKGIVISDIKVDNRQCVVVQYSEHISLRYTHLKDTEVHQGQIVETNQLLGHADNYVHFEYLTSEVNDPSFCILIPPSLRLYKHDPKLILDRNIIFDDSDMPTEEIFLFGEAYHELSNNKGD